MLRLVPLLALALSAPALADGFSSRLEDIELRPEIGTGIYGYELTGNLGVLSLGVRELGDRWLVSWDGDVELVSGAVAYEHPFYALYGAQGQAEAEGGLRLAPGKTVSPYVSALALASLSAIAQAGTPLDGGATINSLDGLGGVIGVAGLRLGAGASFLWPQHSLVIEVQPLAEIDSAQANTALLGFLGAALHARWDWKDSLAALGEVSYAVAPSRADAALGSSATTGRWALSAKAVKRLGRFAVGLGISASRVATELAYAGGATFTSASPIDSRIWALVGFWP